MLKLDMRQNFSVSGIVIQNTGKTNVLLIKCIVIVFNIH